MKRATLTARFFAFVIDVAFLWCVSTFLCLSVIAGHVAGADRYSFKDPMRLGVEILLVFFLSNLFLFLFYFTYLTAHGEMTIGKSIFKIKVVRRRDEHDLGLARAFGRACGYLFSAIPFLLGFLAPFFLKGRAFHDILAGTKVAKEE